MGLCGALAASLFDLYWTHELTGGLRWILHNPGSCFFHLVLFPPVLGLVLFLTYQSIGSIGGFWHELFVAAFVLCFATIAMRAFVIDSRNVEKKRIIEPSDIGSPLLRERALAVDAILRGHAPEVHAASGTPAATPEEVLKILSALAERDELVELDRAVEQLPRDELITDLARVAAASPVLKERVYRSVVDCALAKHRPGDERRFSTLADGSRCAIMGRVLTALAVCAGFSLLFSTVCLVVQRARMKQYHTEMAICTGAFSLWIPMRLYSEYYNGYGRLSLEHFNEIYVAAAAVLVVAIVIAVVAGDSVGGKLAGLAINLLGALVAVLVRHYDVEFNMLAAFVVSLDPGTLLSIQAFFGLGAVLCLVLLLGD